MLQTDPDGFHERVKSAYAACHRAVHDELTRLQDRPAAPARPVESLNDRGGRNGVHASPDADTPVPSGRRRPGPPPRAGSGRSAIAQRGHADLVGVLNDDFGVDRPERLSVAQASGLIDRLKAAAGVCRPASRGEPGGRARRRRRQRRAPCFLPFLHAHTPSGRVGPRASFRTTTPPPRKVTDGRRPTASRTAGVGVARARLTPNRCRSGGSRPIAVVPRRAGPVA